MVNREVDSTSPPIPAVPSRALAASPPTLPSQTPSAPPAGFLVFGPFPPRYSAFCHLDFGAGIGARRAVCRALRHSLAPDPRRPLTLGRVAALLGIESTASAESQRGL